MLQQGATLAGYRIESIAGIGGMGVVYRATQLSLERPVALKVLSSTLVGNRSFRERFRREGRHAAALEHPNIIPVYEAGESNGLMFIAMRLVDGPTLADLMHRHEVTGRDTLRIIGAIASALDAAHDAGLVHRDVKPQNILLTSGGHPYLADFGITKGSAAGGLTRTGDFVGSLSYVAPEQMDGADVGPASDIYSLAAVLFQCLTGALPYERETDAALMHAHLFAPTPTVSDLGPGIPSELDDVFARGLAKGPTERYATAGEMVAACAAVLDELPPSVLDQAPALVPDAEPPITDLERDGAASGEPLVPQLVPAQPLTAPTGDAHHQTAADRQRDGGSAPAPVLDRAGSGATNGVRKGRWALMLAGALLLLAPVAGYAIGGGGGSDTSAPVPVRTGSVGLQADAAWKPGEGAVPGLRLKDSVTLQNASGVVLTSGRLVDPAAGLDPTGKAFRAALPDVKPTTVRVGDRSGVRYAGKQTAGGSAWVVLLPDDRGWTTVACRSAAPDAPLEKVCAPVAATLATPGARAAQPSPDKATAAAITTTLTALNTTQAKAKDELRSKMSTTRAAAARDAARANRRAAANIGRTEVRPQDKALVAALAAALSRQTTAFEQLATAAKRKDRAAYNRARERVARAEREVERALSGLSRGGYRLG